MIKRFVHEAISEALKLERALARLRSDKRIVLLHYAPIQATVMGEPLEFFLSWAPADSKSHSIAIL